MCVTINLTVEGIQYDLFSGFLSGLSEAKESPVDFNEKLFHKLVDYATGLFGRQGAVHLL